MHTAARLQKVRTDKAAAGLTALPPFGPGAVRIVPFSPARLRRWMVFQVVIFSGQGHALR
jgi:hypothetical protein